VLAGSLVPLGAIVHGAATGGLGADPIAQALNQLGLVALVLLVASLACTPLRLATGWAWPIRIRRLLGLLAFLYACLHVATYAAVDQGLDGRAILEAVTERKFTFVGFAAFVLLVPLAATSTRAAVRRLGFARWQRLHRLAYAAGVLAVLHFVWRVKRDLDEPAAYGAVLAALLLWRIARFALDGRRRAAA
jgi:sulfoxide reductase heme-binding subunit YedZ